jgi:hypothetical protein
VWLFYCSTRDKTVWNITLFFLVFSLLFFGPLAILFRLLDFFFPSIYSFEFEFI